MCRLHSNCGSLSVSFLCNVFKSLSYPASSSPFASPFVLRRPRGVGGCDCAAQCSARNGQVPHFSAVGFRPPGNPHPLPLHSVIILRLIEVDVIICGILEAIALNMRKGTSQKENGLPKVIVSVGNNYGYMPGLLSCALFTTHSTSFLLPLPSF